PLLHPTLCLERGFVVGALLLLLLAGSGVAFFLFTLITLQLGAGWGAGAAAATYFPTSLAAIAGALLASRLIPRWGQRVVSLGCALSALGELLALLTINLAGFQLLWWQLLPALIVVGLGQGLAFAPLIGEVLSGLRPQFLAGAANSLANLGLIGKVVGVAGISVLFLTSQSASGGFLPLASSPEHYLKAYQTGLALIAGLTLIATTLTFARPALPSPNALLEPRRSSGLTYTVYLLSGGNIPARIFNDLIRLPTVESKTEVESAPLPLGEFLAYHFESSNEDANWYRYLAEEAQTLGAGPIPQESERRAVVYQKVEEIRQRQMDGLIPSEFDPAAWRLMTFALATCPHLLPQMTRLTTGHAPDTPEFRGLWGKFLRRLGERIAPSV
ncbi:MAG: hypothetical protein ACREP9_21130, partial [Candidatus Dormibacteraceae bacterium]